MHKIAFSSFRNNLSTPPPKRTADYVSSSFRLNTVLILLALVGQSYCVLNCSEVWMAQKTGVNDSCSCVSTAYAWDSTSQQCLCSSIAFDVGDGLCISCGDLENTVQNANSVNGGCSCLDGYIWGDTWKECVLDCGTLPGTVGEADGSAECACQDGLIWNSQTLACELNCILINNTISIG